MILAIGSPMGVASGSVGEVDARALDTVIDCRALTNAASEVERSTGAGAGVLIFSSAARTRDYAKATLAVKALYRFRVARQALRRHFDPGNGVRVKAPPRELRLEILEELTRERPPSSWVPSLE